MPQNDKTDAAKKQISPDLDQLAATKTSSLHAGALGGILDESDEHDSKRVMGPRKRFESCSPIVAMFFKTLKSKKAARKGVIAAGESESKDELVSELIDVLAGPIVKAAEKADLDVEDDTDRELLMCMLAWSIYGGKGPGRGKTWVDDKQRQLLTDFEAVRLANPHLKGEEEICKLLCARKSNFHQYQRLKPRTLRRQLQEAKKLRRLDQQEATVKHLLIANQ